MICCLYNKLDHLFHNYDIRLKTSYKTNAKNKGKKMNQITNTSTTSTSNTPIAFAKEYSLSQTVKIGCSDCMGCNKCCENMDNSIILDPYDMWQFTSTLKLSDGSYATYEILTSEDGPLELTSHEGLACKGVTAIDTIGAGDNFASGFISAILQGKNIRECGVYANCTAAISVQHTGATSGVQNKEMVEEMLAKYHRDYIL